MISKRTLLQFQDSDFLLLQSKIIPTYIKKNVKTSNLFHNVLKQSKVAEICNIRFDGSLAPLFPISVRIA